MHANGRRVNILYKLCEKYAMRQTHHAVPPLGSLAAACGPRTNTPSSQLTQFGLVRSVDHRLCSVRLAGHSKWQNIRHIKAGKDAIKARETARIGFKIRQAVKAGGSSDPKLNFILARAVTQARNYDVPNTTIQAAIKDAVKSQKDMVDYVFECKGPSGSYMIVRATSDKPVIIRNLVQSCFRKGQGKVGPTGTAKHAFTVRGVIQVANSGLDLSAATDLAIELDAEEVEEVTEDDQSVLQFYCDPDALFQIRHRLQERKLDVTMADVQYIPQRMVKLGDDAKKLVDKIYWKLETVDEVADVFDNIEDA